MSDWKNVQYKDGKFQTGSGGGGGGSSTLADLDDVNISSPSDGQVLRYDSASGKWVNADTDISPFSVVDGKVCITFTEV